MTNLAKTIFINKRIGGTTTSSCMTDRHNCLDDVNLGQFLQTFNYEGTVKQLDFYYGIVKRQLLRYQSPITGLYPAMSTDQHVGSIRDSVYCAATIWSLYQAYRRIDDDRGKSYELGQSTVKCMRGILQCWVKQALRVELFKQRQSNKHALHSKFQLHTGEEIYSDDFYNHLQIDVVSLYILFLVQMITSGLQIIYTQDEVAFVQNLVYYVERAYRTPDFGMWERGSKYNNGTPEIHASSIGMAKSALEAVNGCNLFGEKGASWSVVYVDIDAHNRNRSIFETMLPRESSSKGVDSSLLLTLSFPAFASHEERLIDQTKQNIIKRLRNKKGFKRFNRDGFLSKAEDKSRRYYYNGEIKDFEGLECEWPLFFIIMIIDGVFKNNSEQIEEYQNELKRCLYSDSHGDPVVTMYYAPDGEGSYIKAPSQAMFLWGQSLFIIAQLLTDGLLHINELDPIRRYSPSYNRPRKVGRYSAFQGTATDLVVQVVLIAESMRLQAMMATYGIQTQTPHEVEPVQIWSSTKLIKVYQNLGVNQKIGLSGRPPRPVGSLGTSKIYRICGVTVLCYPLIFEVSDFYLYRDMALLIDDIKTELQFVGKYWRLSGRPTFCLLIREEHMRDPQFKEMLDLLAMLKKGYCYDMKVRIGRLQNLLSSSCTEHLDFINQSILRDNAEERSAFGQLRNKYMGYQSLTDVPKAQMYNEQRVSVHDYQHKTTLEIIGALRQTESLYCLCELWGILLKREGVNFNVDGITVGQALTQIYHRGGSLRYWLVVRYCSSLLRHIVDSISPFITTVLVNGKEVTVGVIGQKETVFDKPMTPAEIKDVMYSTVQPYNIIQAVLQQEVVLYCGRLIATNPYIFRGILKIRVGWVLEAMRIYLKISGQESVDLDNLSPYQVRTLLQKVLTVSEWANKERLTTLHRRQLEGCLCRVPKHFYNKIWDILQRTPLGISTQGHLLPANPTLINMSRGELTFSLLVEETLICIDRAERRQIIVELLCIIATILNRNPELHFKQPLDLDEIIMEAHTMYCKVTQLIVTQVLRDSNIENRNDMTPFYSLIYNESISYLARAAVNKVLQGGAFSTQDTEINGEQVQDEMCKIS